jgi:flagellar hook assembly protein FlgD
VGFATPGFVNSNVGGEQSANKITINPEIFEPINGQPNFTQIQYNFEQGGFVATIKILDYQGREIKQIVENAILGTEGFFRWDGDTNEGSKARTGYYTIWFGVFNANGQLNTYRKRVVVASKR